jgi:hypothetical protein
VNQHWAGGPVSPDGPLSPTAFYISARPHLTETLTLPPPSPSPAAATSSSLSPAPPPPPSPSQIHCPPPLLHIRAVPRRWAQPRWPHLPTPLAPHLVARSNDRGEVRWRRIWPRPLSSSDWRAPRYVSSSSFFPRSAASTLRSVAGGGAQGRTAADMRP